MYSNRPLKLLSTLALSTLALACSSGDVAETGNGAAASILDPGECKNFGSSEPFKYKEVRTYYQGSEQARLHVGFPFLDGWDTPSYLDNCKNDPQFEQCKALFEANETGDKYNHNAMLLDGAPFTESFPSVDSYGKSSCLQLFRGRVAVNSPLVDFRLDIGFENFLNENSLPINIADEPNAATNTDATEGFFEEGVVTVAGNPVPINIADEPNAATNTDATEGFFEEGVVTVAGNPVSATSENPLSALTQRSNHWAGKKPSEIAKQRYDYRSSDYVCYDRHGEVIAPDQPPEPHTFCLINSYGFRDFLRTKGAKATIFGDNYEPIIQKVGTPRSPDVGIQYFDKTVLRWDGSNTWADLGMDAPYASGNDVQAKADIETYVQTRAADKHIDALVQIVHRNGNQYCNMEAIRRIDGCGTEQLFNIDKLVSFAEAKVSAAVQNINRGYTDGTPRPARMGCYLPAYVATAPSEAKVNESLHFSPACYKQTKDWVVSTFGESEGTRFQRDPLEFFVHPPEGSRLKTREKLTTCKTADGQPCQNPTKLDPKRIVPTLESFFNSANLH